MSHQEFEIWVDPEDHVPDSPGVPETTLSCYGSFSSEDEPEPEFRPNSALTQSQKDPLLAWKRVVNSVSFSMDLVMQCDMEVRREGDEQELKMYKEDLADEQFDLAARRQEKRRVESRLVAEQDRLKNVATEGREEEERWLAKRQLDEIKEIIKSEKKIECLR